MSVSLNYFDSFMKRPDFLSFFFLIFLVLWPCVSFSESGIRIHDNQNLQTLLDNAATNTTFILAPGVYQGNFLLKQAVRLIGEKGAILDALGQDDAIRVSGSNVVIESLIIRNWGDDLTAMNAGIFVEKDADNVSIINNDMQGDTTGIWIDKNKGAKIINNRIQGNINMRSTDRGNGIHLSNATDAEVRANEVWHTRDGIYIISSQNNILTENSLHNLRYGVHYMYSHSNTVSKNKTRHTRAGYALMQSRLLTVTNNTSLDNEDYGILLNFITKSTIQDNYIDGVRQSEARNVDGADGKGFFIYNSVGNSLRNNVIANAEIGIHLTAGSEGNIVSGNNFIHNQTQVKYVANRTQEWSENGQGNYWSNYLGWDMNNDNIGDNFFEPNDSVDKLLWTFPQTKILMDSPAVWLLRAIQRQFPVLKSPGVRDSFPLMNPRVNG
jgi:nitrous oxidase accessory protein